MINVNRTRLSEHDAESIVSPKRRIAHGSHRRTKNKRQRAKRGWKDNGERELQKIESLPPEILEQIFFLALNLEFAAASLPICRSLNHESVVRSYFKRVFCVPKILCGQKNENHDQKFVEITSVYGEKLPRLMSESLALRCLYGKHLARVFEFGQQILDVELSKHYKGLHWTENFDWGNSQSCTPVLDLTGVVFPQDSLAEAEKTVAVKACRFLDASGARFHWREFQEFRYFSSADRLWRWDVDECASHHRVYKPLLNLGFRPSQKLLLWTFSRMSLASLMDILMYPPLLHEPAMRSRMNSAEIRTLLSLRADEERRKFTNTGKQDSETDRTMALLGQLQTFLEKL